MITEVNVIFLDHFIEGFMKFGSHDLVLWLRYWFKGLVVAPIPRKLVGNSACGCVL